MGACSIRLIASEFFLELVPPRWFWNHPCLAFVNNLESSLTRQSLDHSLNPSGYFFSFGSKDAPVDKYFIFALWDEVETIVGAYVQGTVEFNCYGLCIFIDQACNFVELYSICARVVKVLIVILVSTIEINPILSVLFCGFVIFAYREVEFLEVLYWQLPLVLAEIVKEAVDFPILLFLARNNKLQTNSYLISVLPSPILPFQHLVIEKLLVIDDDLSIDPSFLEAWFALQIRLVAESNIALVLIGVLDSLQIGVFDLRR